MNLIFWLSRKECGLDVQLCSSWEAVSRHAKAFGDFGHGMAAIDHLANRFVFEFGLVSGTAHLTISYAHGTAWKSQLVGVKSSQKPTVSGLLAGEALRARLSRA